MNGHEFDQALRDAAGEPPPMSVRLLAHPRGMTAIAFLLTVLLVLVLVTTRMCVRLGGNNLAARESSSVAQPASAFPCALPVITTSMGGGQSQDPVIQMTPGFVNIPSGVFWVDPAATLQDLPSDKSGMSATYSSPLKRWLPADRRTVSPDERSYVYFKSLPQDATRSTAELYELHVVNAAKRIDQRMWSTADSIGIDRWDSNGILVETNPQAGGALTLWRIDPATAWVTKAPQDAGQPSLPADAFPHIGNLTYSSLGDARQGPAVFRIGARDPGTKYAVVVVESGQVTTIYSGVAGDATGFDPGGVYADAHGLWLGNDDASRVWLWTHSAGLRSFKIIGLPPAPSGYGYTNVSLGPVGECLQGEFQGVAAAALPPPPTPSPPPTVDWSPLLARPLNLQDLPSRASCPVSPR